MNSINPPPYISKIMNSSNSTVKLIKITSYLTLSMVYEGMKFTLV